MRADDGCLAKSGAAIGSESVTSPPTVRPWRASAVAGATSSAKVNFPEPYLRHASSSPATANLSLCPSADGDHTLTLELHNDDHSDYIDVKTGKIVSATEMISTTGP